MIKVYDQTINGGAEFLKVCVNILNSQREQTKHKFSYSKGVCSQAFDFPKQPWTIFSKFLSYLMYLVTGTLRLDS